MPLRDRLKRLYGDPPISLHDLHQCPIDVATFPSNASFVKPSVRTSWARWPVVDATRQALDAFVKRASFDWFFVLSGPDYPRAAAATARHDLEHVSADALIDIQPVRGSSDPRHRGTTSPLRETNPLARRRYLSARTPAIADVLPARWSPLARAGWGATQMATPDRLAADAL
jgi:Core-2/I-Branching enzyme